jgi:hypothetical protein
MAACRGGKHQHSKQLSQQRSCMLHVACAAQTALGGGQWGTVPLQDVSPVSSTESDLVIKSDTTLCGSKPVGSIQQVLLCTATMPQAVAAAAAEWLRKPADCRVTGGDGAAAISPTVTQVCGFDDRGQG